MYKLCMLEVMLGGLVMEDVLEVAVEDEAEGRRELV